MKWFVILACFMIVTPCLLFSQEKGESEPAKAQFRTVSFGKEFDWNGDRKTMTESLNKLGTDGWEVCLCNQRCILLRKSKVPQKWEYKLVKVGRSPLTEWYGYKKEETNWPSRNQDFGRLGGRRSRSSSLFFSGRSK